MYADLYKGDEEYTKQVGKQTYRLDVYIEPSETVYEIQLGNFGKHFYTKIHDLIQTNKVVIVHPISIIQQVKLYNNGDVVQEKTVNKQKDKYSIFRELVSFRHPFVETHMDFHLLLIEESVRRDFVYYRRGRARYHVKQRDLVKIMEKYVLTTKEDFLDMLPRDLPTKFTNKDLIRRLDIIGGKRRKKRIAGCMTYSLCLLGILTKVGKKGRAHLFQISD